MKRILILLFLPAFTRAQELNPIITAFPSLKISTSIRGLSMGDCGVAAATENDQLYYNAAKTAFMQNYHQVSIGYTPWLAAIADDARFLHISYVTSTSNSSAFGMALSYLRLGNVQTRDNNGALIAQYNSNEFNLLTSYALQLSNNSSLGIGLRFLSNQPGQVYDPVNYTTIPKHVFSASADISYYQKIDIDEAKKMEFGAAITNLGPKISIDGSGEKTFLPTNLGIGISYTQANAENTNQFTFALDANKLLVPTPPVYDANGNITAGKDPNRSVLNALFSSFYDAPGGLKEEFREIRINTGAEFAFEKSFFLRAGISLENQTKGNRKYVGFGAGYKGTINDQSWGLDFHCLVPLSTITAISPFQNSWGFTVKFSMGSFE